MRNNLLSFTLVMFAFAGAACSMNNSAMLPDPVIKAHKAASSSTDLISCLPDRPVVYQGESVQVRLYVNKQNTDQRSYHWRADAGTLETDRDRAIWHLQGVEPGRHLLTATITSPTGPRQQCVVKMTVREKLLSVRSDTRRVFLLPGESEEMIYRVYSYLLIRTKPVNDIEKRRCLALIRTYLTLLEDLTAMHGYFTPEQLNVTYLLLTATPPKNITPTWIMENYDYPRARFILNSLIETYQQGPYIISADQPLTPRNQKASIVVTQDFSYVRIKLIDDWVRAYLNQMAQQHDWHQKTFEQTALKIRNVLALLSQAVYDIRPAIEDWIVLARTQ